MIRQRVVQRRPAKKLDGFPITTIDDDVFRAARLSPWWFCRCGECRFDLHSGATHGTMYAGTDEITGVLETIGPEMDGRPISRVFLSQRWLWALRYDRAVEVANLTDDAAVGFGVTNELSTMVPYDIPKAWAAAFESAGFDGIAYRTRFNTGTATTGVALFDDAGAHDWDATRLHRADDPSVIAELKRRYIKVKGAPTLAALKVL